MDDKAVDSGYHFSDLIRPDGVYSRFTTRLLRVHPSDRPLVIRCEIVQAPERALHIRFRYAALSYVWGRGPHLNKVYIYDNQSSGWLKISSNLFGFLQEVVRRGDNSWFWIDALCIDQTNIAERNHQVGWMGEIYKNAYEVIVWMNDPVISQLFHMLINPQEWQSNLRRSPAAFIATNAFVKNEYWKRAWIRQEFILAKSVVFWSARSHLTYYNFLFMATHWLPRVARTIHDTEVNIRTLINLKSSKGEYKPRRLIQCLDVKGVECSDSRDRVYSMLSLSSDTRSLPVDYSVSEYRVLCNILLYVDNSFAMASRAILALDIDPRKIQKFSGDMILSGEPTQLRGTISIERISSLLAKYCENEAFEENLRAHNRIVLANLSGRNDVLVAKGFLDLLLIFQISQERESQCNKCIGWLYEQPVVAPHTNRDLICDPKLVYNSIDDASAPEGYSQLFEVYGLGATTGLHSHCEIFISCWQFSRVIECFRKSTSIAWNGAKLPRLGQEELDLNEP